MGEKLNRRLRDHPEPLNWKSPESVPSKVQSRVPQFVEFVALAVYVPTEPEPFSAYEADPDPDSDRAHGGDGTGPTAPLWALLPEPWPSV